MDEDISKYFPLVHSICNKYRPALIALHIDYEDAFQIGCIGLVEAIRKHEPNRGRSLASFAYLKISAELCHHFRYCNLNGRNKQYVSLDAPANEHQTSFLQFIPDPTTDLQFDDAMTAATVDKLNVSSRGKRLIRSIFQGNTRAVDIYRNAGLTEKQYYNSVRAIREAAREVFYERREATC